MFSHLKKIVDLITSGISVSQTSKGFHFDGAVALDVIKVYFLLKDCVDEGENLILESQGSPIEKIRSMGPDEGTLTVQRWDISLRKQGVRLRWLQDYVFGQHHLAVITPDLQERISEVVGYKMDRVQTLHGIGAELFLRVVFPIDETHEDKAGLICMMAGEEKNAFLNMKRILAEIRDLREALDDYRRVVERLVSNEELLSLSASARQQTLIK